MSTGRSNKLTGQIGEYLVCAELGRRGFIATPFSGNVPAFDVVAIDEKCRTVPIQVKASQGDNWPSDARNWMDFEPMDESRVQKYISPKKILNPDLIYVCVSIAKPEKKEKDRFFILTKSNLQTACIADYSKFMNKHNWLRPHNPESYDNRYHLSSIEEYENNWELITNRLNTSNPDQSLIADSETLCELN